ncbi:hypothetical protein SDC9_137406 [bioreactor metagenome]|uniref:Uncharacterized protein n=1 Tax=bioreactor metagenome TaxID=1076179 RepID=A0A645DLZ5_9ZZZZ
MNPLRLFDYCYYRIAFLYEDIYLEHQKELAGIAFLSFFQILNTITIISLIFQSTFVRIIPEFHFFGYIIILIFNYVRYKKITSYSKLHERWKNERYYLRVLHNLLVILYIILSCVFLVIATS